MSDKNSLTILSLPEHQQMALSGSLLSRRAASAEKLNCPTSLKLNRVRGLGQDCSGECKWVFDEALILTL
jgi:hypothetical protein